MKIQPRQRGRARQPLPACVQRELMREVAHCARRYDVSRSWVVAVALGEAFGIDVISYAEPKGKLRLVKR